MRILLLWLISASLFGQDKNGLYPHTVGPWRIGIIPSSMIEVTPVYNLHVSKGLSDMIEAGTDIGYASARPNDELVQGMVLRPSIRFYPIPTTGLYFGLQGDFRYTEKDKARFVERFGGQYQQYFEFVERSTYSGAMFSIGQVMNYGSFCVDAGCSLGSTRRYTWHRGLPTDVGMVGLRSANGSGTRLATFLVRLAILYSFE